MGKIDAVIENRANALLVFVHIPKTAGVTFSTILAGFYQPGVYSIYSTAEIAKFQQLTEAQRGTYELLQGHFPYGIHDYIPRPTQYITFLRDPVARVVSLYYF